MRKLRIVVALAILAAMTQVLRSPAGGATQFANSTPITIPALGATVPAPWPGSPYPSSISVTGLTGTVTDVNVTLDGLDCSSTGPDFAYAEDLDLLVVGPTGANLLAVSDIGGDNLPPAGLFTDITVTLDDQAAAPLPADAQLAAGTYRPFDDDDDVGEQVAADTLPMPAPPPSAATSLAAFNGTDPNGMWSLYLADDYAGPNNCRVLRGWSVQITTTSDPTTTAGPTTTADSTTTTVAPSTTTTMAPTTTTTAPTTTTTTVPPGPGEGLWTRTASLSVPRFDHTTTLMTGGQVLAAGGRTQTPNQPVELLTSAEVYDPRNEKWRTTGSLADARWSHTATLLPDGRVLVAGGFGAPYTLTGSGAGSNAQPVLATAEIFNPKTGRWSRTPAMSTRRALHSAVLLRNGKVLVAGGRTCNAAPPVACNFTFVTTSAELFDPATGTWAPTAPMSAPRHTTAATLLADGRALVPSGFVGAGAPSGTADVYDPATGTWSSTAPLNRARSRQGAMLLPNGRVLVASGFQGLNTTELFDPSAGAWSLTGNLILPTARFNFQFGTMPNGKALVAGGATFPPASRPLSAEVFDPSTGLWAPAAQMNDEHGSSSSLSNSQRVVVLSSNPWRFELKPSACAPNCGKVLVAGNNVNGTVELYTPSCGSIPRPPEQTWCVQDGGAPGRQSAPGTPGEEGPPEWIGAEEAVDARPVRTTSWS